MYLIALALCAAVSHPEPVDLESADTMILFDFRQEESVGPWQRLNDTVMGGVSESDLKLTGEFAVFSGMLSLENNGGFASVRSVPEQVNLSDYDAIALRLRGDGKRYALRLRTDPGWDGITYHASFDTVAGEWIEVVVPFEDLQPQFRGRRVPQAGPLDASSVHTFGIMITDKQEGAFRLDIEWLQAVKHR